MHVAKIARNGDYIPVPNSPVNDLWNRPNPHYNRRTLEKAIGLSLKCDGNAYVYKVRDRVGRLSELWWVPHYRIFPKWPDDGSEYVNGYRVWLDQGNYSLPAEDVIHIRDGIDPRNERLGLSAVRACIREACTVNLESSYCAALLRNSGVPSYAIIPDQDTLRPSVEDVDRIKKRFEDNTSNDYIGSPVVMGGRYKLQEMGFSPEKLALDKLPLNAIARIAASMGVAAMSLGLPDPQKTYANLAEANRTSWGTIVSIQELVSEALRWQLLPEFDIDPNRFVIEYDYSNIQELQEALDAVHGRAREDFKAGVCTLNEAREMVGREPVDDGDRYFPGTEPGAAMGGLGDMLPGQEPSGAPALNGLAKRITNGLTHKHQWP
jgi:HK97 family phage portal protein